MWPENAIVMNQIYDELFCPLIQFLTFYGIIYVFNVKFIQENRVEIA